MLRWIKDLRAREARQTEEEQSRSAGVNDQPRGSSHASPTAVQELDSSSSGDEEAPQKKKARHALHPIPRKERVSHSGASLQVECNGKCRLFDALLISFQSHELFPLNVLHDSCPAGKCHP